MTNFTNTVLYIGVTNNLLRRTYEHHEGLCGNSFTKLYKLTKLVYYEVYEDPETAINREKTLKNLVRRKKVALMEKMNPKWEDLYKDLV